jgi:hypothetical protein
VWALSMHASMLLSILSFILLRELCLCVGSMLLYVHVCVFLKYSAFVFHKKNCTTVTYIYESKQALAFSFFGDDLGYSCSESIGCDLRRYLHTTWYCCSVVDVLELKWGETYIAPHQMDWLAKAWVIRYPWASTNCKHASWPGEYSHLASTNSVTPVEQTLQSLVNTSLGLPSLVLMFNILCLLFIIIEIMH